MLIHFSILTTQVHLDPKLLGILNSYEYDVLAMGGDEQYIAGKCMISTFQLEELVAAKEAGHSLPADIDHALSSCWTSHPDKAHRLWQMVKEDLVDVDNLEEIGYPIEGKIAFVHALEVHPHYRNQGIGTMFLQSIKTKLELDHVAFILLMPHSFKLHSYQEQIMKRTLVDVKLRQFYRSLGFYLTKGDAKDSHMICCLYPYEDVRQGVTGFFDY